MQAAAFALADLGDVHGFQRLMQMLPRPRNVDMTERKAATETAYQNRHAAAQALGRYRRAEAVPALMKVVEDVKDDPAIRVAAATAIGAIATTEQMEQVLAKAEDTTLSENTRRYYPLSLWQKPRLELVEPLLDKISESETSPELRLNSALAVGYTADPKADARLLAMLDAEGTRRDAAFAVILGGNEEAGRKLLTLLTQDVGLREVFQDDLSRKNINRFDLLTASMFETGSIWRRLRVAQILRDGEGGNTYSQAWIKITTVLRAGSEGADGASADFVRQALWSALKGNDPERRKLAADALVAMSERGLVLRARDEGGVGAEEARAAMRIGGGES
jgi:hypothetical protein